MMAALVAATAAVACAGVVLHDGSRARCRREPPLVTACTAVRTCRDKGACVITVTGRIAAAEYAAGEAWGDWLARLHDAPPEWGVSAAAVEHLRPDLVRPPYTVFLVGSRPPLYYPDLFVDDAGWLRTYRGSGVAPAGLRRAPASIVRRLCPR